MHASQGHNDITRTEFEPSLPLLRTWKVYTSLVLGATVRRAHSANRIQDTRQQLQQDSLAETRMLTQFSLSVRMLSATHTLERTGSS